MIIKAITANTLGYRDNKFYIPALFFADDGLLLANSIRQAEQLFCVMRKAAEGCGLEINTLKSNCMIFNSAAVTMEKFLGMDVVKQIKYLGVTVDDKRNCFQQHKKQKILQARRMTNLTYSVIARSCNKMLLGKTYWKSVVLPNILYASSVVTWTKKELEDLQRTDTRFGDKF